MFKEQLLVSVPCLSLIVKFKFKLYFVFFSLKHQFQKVKVVFTILIRFYI